MSNLAVDASRAGAAAAGAPRLVPAQLAKAALRRLVQERLEPTPENYANAYRLEAGAPSHAAAATELPAQAQRLVQRMAAVAFDADAAVNDFMQALAQGRWGYAEQTLDAALNSGSAGMASLIGRLARSIERGGKNWTSARKKDGLQRVLDGSRADARRLQQRLTQLVLAWDNDTPSDELELGGAGVPQAMDEALAAPAAPAATAAPAAPTAPIVAQPVAAVAADDAPHWKRMVDTLGGTVQQALQDQTAGPHEMAEALAGLTRKIKEQGASAALVDELEGICQRSKQVVEHRHHLLEQLGGLCHELTASLTELAENDSWAKGQCDAMRVKLEEGLTARGVRSVRDLLRDTRLRQGKMQVERENARDALKSLINRMLGDLGELGSQTGRFHDSVGRYASVIESADSLESLTGVVREMVDESRTVQLLVKQTQTRLQDEHAKATDLTQRVSELENELRRLSDEVSTDQLTQIANRRGLLQAFAVERERVERTGATLSIGLLDIDNFKRLNDELGHSVGDVALKSLATMVSTSLRPTDVVARYGGEEFVVLLPGTDTEAGEQLLSRLQRSLTGGMFMHEKKQVLVTFSAGVTAFRLDEALEVALERADQALYKAKRTGKNRTCVA